MSEDRTVPVHERVSLDADTLIEASAGTGKTYAIERILERLLVERGVDIAQVLVVTFSEAATEELRIRIRQMLATASREPGRAGERAQAALGRIQEAPIHTIHAFCQRALLEHAFDSGELFDQGVIDGGEVFGRAFRDVLRTTLAHEPAHRERLLRWTAEKSVEDLRKLLQEAARLRFLEHVGAGPEPDELLRDAEALRDLWDRDAVRFAVENGISSGATQIRARAFAAIERFHSEVPGTSGPTLLDALAACAAPLREALHRRDKKARPAFAGRSARFDAQLARFHERYVETKHVGYMLATRRMIETCLPPVLDRVTALKRELCGLDFSDMLGRLDEALSRGDGDGERLLRALRGRYAVAIVDEFQDTDELQWSIFRRIFRESDRHQLLVVGDPKQAIYRFRGADVHAYIEARNVLAPDAEARLSLPSCYRATKSLVDAYNLILQGEAFFDGGDGIDYRRGVDTPADAPWAKAGPSPDSDDVKPIVVLADYEGLKADEGRRVHTDAIASEIRRLTSGRGIWLHERRGEDPPDPRPLTFEDMMVLCLSNDNADMVAQTLSRAGIPNVRYKRDGLFQTEEARQIHELLAAVAEPADRERRLRAWRSGFFEVPYVELFDARELGEDHELAARLRRWNALLSQESLPRVLRRILDESGYARRAVLFGDDERALANVRHIFELLIEASAGQRGTLHRLVSTLSTWIGGSGAPAGQNPGRMRRERDGGAVRVMTMHASKGLEAPIVFLFGGLRGGGGGGPIVEYRAPVEAEADSDGGTERRLYVPQSGVQMPDVVERSRTLEKVREHRRLMYVALTRAKVRLYLHWLAGGGQTPGPYGAVNGRLEALSAAQPDGFDWKDIAEVADGGELPEAEVESYDPHVLVDALAATSTPTADLKAVEGRNRLVSTSYSYRGRGHKVPWDPDVHRDPHLRGKAGGSCVHEVLEHIPIESFVDSDGRPVEFEDWMSLDEVVRICRARLARHGVPQAALETVLGMAWNALGRPLVLPNGRALGPLHGSRLIREMDFTYPIPESGHPTLGDVARSAGWRIGRGRVNGSIDAVFEASDGQAPPRVWLADWKTDQMRDYGVHTMAQRVDTLYADQALLYSLAVARWLGVRDEADYERRFGGWLYVFVRGLGPGAAGDGVYAGRPSWAELRAFERGALLNDPMNAPGTAGKAPAQEGSR